MRYFKYLWIPILVGLILTGCAGNYAKPETTAQKLAYADGQFTALVETATDLLKAGIMPDEYVDEVDTLIQSGNESLDVAWSAYGDGDEDTALAAIRGLKTVTIKLRMKLQEVQNE